MKLSWPSFCNEKFWNDFELRLLGAGLAFTHVLTFLYWDRGQVITDTLNDPVRVCWSFYQNCSEGLKFEVGTVRAFFLGYLLLSLFVIHIFLFTKRAWLGQALLFLLFVYKAFWFFQDYRLMGNYHYMTFWLAGAYLFSRDRKYQSILMVVLFYFCSGWLKCSNEWLSGAALIGKPIISALTLTLALIFVVYLELYLSFWLISKSKVRRVWALILFFSFHIFSWHIVGYFYPSVMFSLILFLVPHVLRPTKVEFKFNKCGLWPISFLLCQAIPLAFFPNSAVDGIGRVLSLNMMDARVSCAGEIYLKKGNQYLELPWLIEDLGLRISCDPLVLYSQAKTYCKVYPNEDLEARVVARRATDVRETQILAISDFCRKVPEVSFLGTIR